MVNASRVKRKLPSLLINGETTSKKHWAERNRISYRLSQFRKRNPQKYDTIVNTLIMAIESFEKALCEQK